MIEGKVSFEIGAAFFRLETRASRDLGVLAAAVYRQKIGQLRVLEVMAGSGVRSLRYWLESGADELWVNDGNPELKPLLEKNLAEVIAHNRARVTSEAARRIFAQCYLQQDFYDFVDVDGFGSPVSFMEGALGATKRGGLLYLTSTDGRSLTGHDRENCLRNFGVIARAHPASQEQALRILLGSLQQRAASEGWGLDPIFSYFTGDSYRLMVRITHKTQLNNINYGFLGYCHYCGEYQPVNRQYLHRSSCLACEQSSLVLSGMLWLGKLHDRPFLEAMMILAKTWQWDKITNLLALMTQEIDFPPYHYTLGEIGRRGKLDLPKRSQLIHWLQQAGFRAVGTHINPQAIKTNAKLADCIAIARKDSIY